MACGATAVPDRRLLVLVRLPCPCPCLRLARSWCRDEAGVPAPVVLESSSSHTHAPQFSVSAPQAGPSRSVPQPVVAVGERRCWQKAGYGEATACTRSWRTRYLCVSTQNVLSHPPNTRLFTCRTRRDAFKATTMRGAQSNTTSSTSLPPRPTSLLRTQTRIHVRDIR